MVQGHLRKLTLLLGFLVFQATCTAGQPVSRQGIAEAPDGVAISYRMAGSRGQPIVLVHGWACDQTYWSDQIPYLAARARVVTIDLAGHGESGTNRSEWSIARYAGDVIAVLEAEDLHDVILVGHSLGGPVVLEAALLASSRVSGVVGIDTFFDLWLQPGLYDTLLERMRVDFATVTRDWVQRASFIETSPSELVDRIAADMSLQSPASGIPALAALGDWGLSRMQEAFDSITVPLGVVQSSGAIATLGVVEAQRSRLPFLRIVEMDAVGHFMMSEDPSRFNELLWDLLADLHAAS